MRRDSRPGPFGSGTPVALFAGDWSSEADRSGAPPDATARGTPPEIPLASDWVAREMKGVVHPAGSARSFSGVSIDTRTLAAGELFVAIRGDRFDGADFVGAAISAGAAGIVVERGRAVNVGPASEMLPAPVVIEVDDCVAALQALARAVRRESRARVVAITGSAGKTTTKEITADFLETRYRVMRNRGNFNNHIGLPLSLIDLRKRPEIAVVELGMNHAGEISTLVRIAEPDVRVWTNVGEAHLGFFRSIDDIADAKAEIFEDATATTILVANADDERIASRVGRFRGRVVTFGIDRDADVRATEVRSQGIGGTEARVATSRGALDLATPLIGRGNLSNVLAATAVALELEVPLAEVAARARRLAPAARRGEVLSLANGITVIDDSYNANPTATRGALDLLADAAHHPRRIAVLGEMLELGEHAVPLHEEIGRVVAAANTDLLVAVGGPPARALADAAVTAGMPRANVLHFLTSDEAAASVASRVRPGDLVLVKGSRGVRTDRIVDRLKAECA